MLPRQTHLSSAPEDVPVVIGQLDTSEAVLAQNDLKRGDASGPCVQRASQLRPTSSRAANMSTRAHLQDVGIIRGLRVVVVREPDPFEGTRPHWPVLPRSSIGGRICWALENETRILVGQLLDTARRHTTEATSPRLASATAAVGISARKRVCRAYRRAEGPHIEPGFEAEDDAIVRSCARSRSRARYHGGGERRWTNGFLVRCSGDGG